MGLVLGLICYNIGRKGVFLLAVSRDENTNKWKFRVYVTHPVTGERIQKKRRGFELRRDALEAESKFLSEYKTKKVVFTNVKMKTAIDSYIRYLENRIKVTSLSSYIYQINKQIRPYFDNLEIRRITRLVIDNWYDELLSKNLTASYKNNILRKLTGIFEFIELEYDHRMGYIHNLPPFQVTASERKRKTTIYTEKQFNRLIEYANNDLERAIFFTLFLSGLRMGELRGLKWKDIDFDNRTIDVKRQLTSKITGSPSLTITPKSDSSIRSVHIPNVLYVELKKWNDSRRLKKKYNKNWQVFGDYGTVHENTIRRYLRKAAVRAELPHVTPHNLRHSYVTLLYQKGVAPEVIKEQLGHSSIQVTLDIYNHITSSQKQHAIDEAFSD